MKGKRDFTMVLHALIRLFVHGGLLLIIACGGRCHAQTTLKIWPDEHRGNGVTYGGDVKLTLWTITDNNSGITNMNAVGAVNQRFADDLKMDLVRVPMVAKWGAADNKFNNVRDYASDAQQKGMAVFLSVANTNGQFKSDGETLEDGHRQDKFASWMLCSGCSNDGLYGVNLDKYKSWMSTLLNKLDYNVDYLGPWNEDPASFSDYTSLDLSIPLVGVETWGLDVAASRYDLVKDAIDVAGSHNYVSGGAQPDLRVAYNQWEAFAAVEDKPEWFTETTLFAKSTAEGIAHMLPAISSGIEKMIIYQAVPRIITETGSNGPHYAATKRLIDYSKGKGAALRVETDDSEGVIAAFKDGTNLLIHLCNVDASQRTMYVNLQNGYTINSVSKQSYGGSVTTTIRNEGQQIQVEITSKTYVHVTASGLSVSGPPSNPPPPAPSPPPPSPPTPSSTTKFIENKFGGRRLWANPGTNEVKTVPNTSSGTWVQWKEEEKNSNYIFLNHPVSDKRLYSDDEITLKLKSTSNQKAQWKKVDVGNGWYQLQHRKSDKWLQVLDNGSDVGLGDFSTTDKTTWKFV